MVIRRFTIIIPAALVLAIVMSVVGCGGDEGGGGEGGSGEGGGSKTVTIATDIAYPPFEFTRDGKPTGFDIDLMREIGKRAGFTPEFQNVRFDLIISGLDNNLYDAAISAMTITEDREEQIDFSDPYFNADQSLLVPGDSNIRSTVDLSDATVGVQLGTMGAAQADEFQSEGTVGEVRTFDTIEDAFAALKDGQVDAVINNLPVSQDRADQSDGRLKVVETIPTGEQYGIAFPKDSELVDPVNEALAEIKDDGTYEKIYKKWIGRVPEDIP
jgi:ABC-type amino acid transport substrate-binding protein